MSTMVQGVGEAKETGRGHRISSVVGSTTKRKTKISGSNLQNDQANNRDQTQSSANPASKIKAVKKPSYSFPHELPQSVKRGGGQNASPPLSQCANCL